MFPTAKIHLIKPVFPHVWKEHFRVLWEVFHIWNQLDVSCLEFSRRFFFLPVKKCNVKRKLHVNMSPSVIVSFMEKSYPNWLHTVGNWNFSNHGNFPVHYNVTGKSNRIFLSVNHNSKWSQSLSYTQFFFFSKENSKQFNNVTKWKY